MNFFSLYKLWIYGAMVLALVGGYAGWTMHQRDIGAAREIAACNANTAAQKAEASSVLAKALADTAAAQAALADFKTKLEKDREISQAKNAADLRNRLAGQRLQFSAQIAGCRGGGAAAQSAAPGAAGDPAATVIQLPEPINGNLLRFSADAESLKIDYGILYSYVNNPALVCELRQ